MTTKFRFDEAAYTASSEWIVRECTNRDELHAAAGISVGELAQLNSIGMVPRPTYKIFDSGIISPAASLGVAGTLIGAYYGPAVIGWLRRASTYSQLHGPERVRLALMSWLETDFRTALIAQLEAAAQFGWAHLFEGGTLSTQRFIVATTQLWYEWLGGEWAVCLKRFTGHDVVTKGIELERIPAFVKKKADRAELIDSMLRFDEITRPFAPFERPISSRRRVIDMVVMAGGLPWPSLEMEGRTSSSRSSEADERRADAIDDLGPARSKDFCTRVPGVEDVFIEALRTTRNSWSSSGT